MVQHKTIKSRRQQNREAIINDVIAIAREMMRKDGVAALSFNAIARELGIKPPSLYTYFDSKNAIYDAVFRQGFIEFEAMMRNRPDKGGTFVEGFRSAIRAYMQFAFENPELFYLMFERPVPDFEPSEESMQVSLSALAYSREEFGELIRSADIHPDMRLEEAQDILITFTHGLTALHMANHPDLPIGEGRFGKLIDHIVRMVMQAWKNPEMK